MQIQTWLALVAFLLLLGAGTRLQGATTVTLGNGGYLVVDPDYDAGSVLNVGRVRVYSQSGTLLTTVYGDTANDRVGSGGAVAIGTSRYVICSPEWDNGSIVDAGAITYGYEGLQFLGPIAQGGSTWAGSTANDQVGGGGITKVGTGFCIVHSPLWDNGAAVNAGAVTFIVGDSVFYSTGAISAGNSLVGGSTGDHIGRGGIVPVGTDHYLIHSPLWDNGAATDAGALTRGSTASIGVFGLVTASNSMVGTSAGDQIGSGEVTVVGTDRVIIHSPLWDNDTAADAGAVSVKSISSFSVGDVTAANSFVGSSPGDQVGSGGITVVGTDRMIIHSPRWDNGTAADAGAVAVRSITPFTAATLGTTNAFVGTSPGDQVGSGGITVVGTDRMIIRSPLWDNGTATDAGAVAVRTITPFTAATLGVSTAFVGSSAGDQVGSGGVTVVGTDRMVIRSPLWDNGDATNAGAVAVRTITPFTAAIVSSANSLVGTTANDQISSGGISFVGTDYVVVRSPLWDNGDVANVGAVSVKSITPFSGGSVSATNAIVGSTANDQVGSGGVTVVGTEVVLVRSPLWDNGGIVNAGAVTRVIPVSSTSRTVSTTNSIVGGSANDQVGSGGITVLGTTAYLIRSPLWDHSVAADAGAVTFDTVSIYSSGAVSRSNSLVGSHANDQIGSGGITTAGGGATFTISSPNWCYGAGASTAGNSTDGVLGVVSSSNSTVGAESAVPEIAVLQPAPTEVANNGTRDFGDVAVGSTQGLSFVIKNTGTDDLYLTGSTRVARSGTDAGLFSVVAQPTNLIVAGDSLSFTLNFTPTSEGDKTAQISISNTDSNESPYRVNLTGSGLSAMGGWRKTHFGSSANTGSAADAADFDNDGIPNLVEYALGLHPAQSTTAAGQLPVPASDGGGNFGLSFTAPAGLSGVTYGAEWSPSLVGGSWLPVTDTGTPPQHVFSVPTAGNAQIFLRLKILAVP